MPIPAGQEHYLAFAGLCSRPSRQLFSPPGITDSKVTQLLAAQQDFEFFFSPNKRSQSPRVQRVEAALN
jgi:hypothetical protein